MTAPTPEPSAPLSRSQKIRRYARWSLFLIITLCAIALLVAEYVFHHSLYIFPFILLHQLNMPTSFWVIAYGLMATIFLLFFKGTIREMYAVIAPLIARVMMWGKKGALKIWGILEKNFPWVVDPEKPARGIIASLICGGILLELEMYLLKDFPIHPNAWPWSVIASSFIAPLMLLIWYWRHIHKMEELGNKQTDIRHDEMRMRNDQFSCAVEHLGHTEYAIRMGAIHELMTLAKEAPADYATPVANMLDSFLRLRSSQLRKECLRTPTTPEVGPPTYNTPSPFPEDITLALLKRAELNRTHRKKGIPAMSTAGLFLRGMYAPHADLSNANLAYTDLSEANLHDANLCGADLSGTDLSYANLPSAYLSRAHLLLTKLCEANLSAADLSHTRLSGAGLSHTKLSGAELYGAKLYTTDLSKAEGLSTSQIDNTKGDMRTKLPDGIERPADWPAYVPDEAIGTRTDNEDNDAPESGDTPETPHMPNIPDSHDEHGEPDTPNTP